MFYVFRWFNLFQLNWFLAILEPVKISYSHYRKNQLTRLIEYMNKTNILFRVTLIALLIFLSMLLWKLFVCVQPSLATYLSLFENDARKFCPRGNKSWEFWHDWNSAIFENCPRLLLDCSVYNNVHNVIHHFQGLFFLSKFLIMIIIAKTFFTREVAMTYSLLKMAFNSNRVIYTSYRLNIMLEIWGNLS